MINHPVITLTSTGGGAPDIYAKAFRSQYAPPPPAKKARKKRTDKPGPKKAELIPPVIVPGQEMPVPIPPELRTIKADGSPRSAAGQIDMRLDRQKMSMFEGALLAGNTYQNACLLAGIGHTTFWRYMREGEIAEDNTTAKNFWYMVKTSIAMAEHRAVLGITNAGVKNWTAYAWFLERRNPEQWAARTRLELTGQGGGPIQSEHRELPNVKLSREDMDRVLKRIYSVQAQAEQKGIVLEMEPASGTPAEASPGPTPDGTTAVGETPSSDPVAALEPAGEGI